MLCANADRSRYSKKKSENHRLGESENLFGRIPHAVLCNTQGLQCGKTLHQQSSNCLAELDQAILL